MLLVLAKDFQSVTESGLLCAVDVTSTLCSDLLDLLEQKCTHKYHTG